MASEMLFYTLITGASSGLGAEFAQIAAADGRNLTQFVAPAVAVEL